MVQKLMFALTLILATTWLMAQEPASKGSSSQAGTAASSGSGQTAVEGCLQGSNGSFTLTDKAGTIYQLQGDTSKLAEHVGHEVQITGTTSSAASAGASEGSSGASSSAGGSQGGQTLTVEKVKHMSKTCKEMGK